MGARVDIRYRVLGIRVVLKQGNIQYPISSIQYPYSHSQFVELQSVHVNHAKMTTQEKTVLVTLRKQRWQVEPGKTARQVIQSLDLNPENYLTMVNGQLTDDSVRLKAGDHLKLVAVISGGAHAA